MTPSRGRGAVVKQLTIVVRPFRAEAVLKVIQELDVNACLVQEAKGYSRQKGYLDRYQGSEYSMAFLPKVEISVWVQDPRAAEVADKLVRAARTGRIGDGKVFVVDVSWPGAMEF
jgi:nitrogen regulatory protein P-II 2